MRLNPKLILLLLLTNTLFSSPGIAYDFLQPEFAQLRKLIEQSLQEQASRGEPENLRMGEINQAYLNLPRNGSDTERVAEDLFEMKMAVMSWRQRTKEYLLETISSGSLSGTQLLRHLSSLKHLGIQLHDQEMLEVKQQLDSLDSDSRETFLELIAVRGRLGKTKAELLTSGSHESLLQAGPLVYPDMIAEKPQIIPFESWAADPSYSEYEGLTRTSVFHKGIQFQAGDFILVDEARPVAGFMPAFFSPRQNTNHFAVFSIREFEGRLVPIVYDFADTFRVIPLNLFLSERFITSGNVLRHKETSSEKASKVEPFLAKMHARNNLAFNMAALEDGDPKDGFTCGTFSLHLMKHLGLSRPIERSTVTGELIDRNLTAVAYQRRGIFSPVNLLQSDYFDFVGTVDNGYFGTVLVRTLINTSLAELMHTQQLNPDEFGPLYQRTLRGIKLLRDSGGLFSWKTFRAWILRSRFAPDHNRDTFPKGAAETLAAYQLFFTRGMRSEKKLLKQHDCVTSLGAYGEDPTRSFSFSQFHQGQHPIQASVHQAAKSRFQPSFLVRP